MLDYNSIKSFIRSKYQIIYNNYLHSDSVFRFFNRHIWNKVDKIPGHLVSPSQEFWLYKTARELLPDSIIVEIGSFKGRSTSCLAFGCVGTKKRVYSIDTFNGNEHDFFDREFYNTFINNLDYNKLLEYVTPLIGDSSSIAKKWELPINMLFVDGSHKYQDVLNDFKNFYPFVIEGGIIAFHDITPGWKGCYDAWNDVIVKKLKKVQYCSTIGIGYK